MLNSTEVKNSSVDFTDFQDFSHVTQVDIPITPRALCLTLLRTSPVNFGLGNFEEEFHSTDWEKPVFYSRWVAPLFM